MLSFNKHREVVKLLIEKEMHEMENEIAGLFYTKFVKIMKCLIDEIALITICIKFTRNLNMNLDNLNKLLFNLVK